MDYQTLEKHLIEFEFDKIYEQFGSELGALIEREEFSRMGKAFMGKVKALRMVSVIPLGHEGNFYVWLDDTEKYGIQAQISHDGVIESMLLKDFEKFPETDAVYTITKFRYPFDGPWFVAWGGTNEMLNYHYAYEHIRYAYDFIVMKDGFSYEGDPEKNESYFAFGQDLLAPADGVVIAIENNVYDNEPVGEMNEESPGNYCIIDHGNNEISFLGHFKFKSIRVNVGDAVKAGDVLGLVGNSGNSSEPHNHFHVENTETNKSVRIRLDKEYMQGEFTE